MNRSNKGSTHVVVIIVLIIALLGALGFVFWQNFIQKTTANTATVTSTNPTAKDGVYDNGDYSFEYPTKGWKLVEEEYAGIKYPSIRSDDYEPSAQGVKAGAYVTVSVDPLEPVDKTIDQSIEELKIYPYIQDVKKITVDGKEALSMRSGYEGWRNTTEVYSNGKDYGVIYLYDDEDKEAKYKEAYEMIVSTLKVH